jgi:glyoxalase family protein
VARTGFRVGTEASLQWWAKRFAAEGVAHDAPAVRDGRGTLDFQDGEGQRLSRGPLIFCAITRGSKVK